MDVEKKWRIRHETLLKHVRIRRTYTGTQSARTSGDEWTLPTPLDARAIFRAQAGQPQWRYLPGQRGVWRQTDGRSPNHQRKDRTKGYSLIDQHLFKWPPDPEQVIACLGPNAGTWSSSRNQHPLPLPRQVNDTSNFSLDPGGRAAVKPGDPRAGRRGLAGNSILCGGVRIKSEEKIRKLIRIDVLRMRMGAGRHQSENLFSGENGEGVRQRSARDCGQKEMTAGLKGLEASVGKTSNA